METMAKKAGNFNIDITDFKECDNSSLVRKLVGL